MRRIKASMNTSNQNVLRPPEAERYLGGVSKSGLAISNQNVLRPLEASEYLGLSASTLAKQRLRGDGPKFVRLSPRAIGYLQADLDDWLASKRFSSTSEYGRLTSAPQTE
jgi:predicted DNA-binding transcriptional regulator AlpA